MNKNIKPVNLHSICDLNFALKSNRINNDLVKKYEQYLGITLKDSEYNDIHNLLNYLYSFNLPVKVDGIFLDYHIPAMSKEMDIIKISDNIILNIELKSKDKTLEERKNQLIQNRFYLSKTKYDNIFYFSYKSSDNSLYQLEDDSFTSTDQTPIKLIELLNKPNKDNVHIEDLLIPSDYLVSPFNDPQRFLDGEYLLTNSQKSKEVELTQILSTNNCVFLSGNPGTGKTLVLYDYAKKLISEGNSVYILHGGNLNDGHEYLKQHGLNIYPIFKLQEILSMNNDTNTYFMIDEVQRLNETQITEIRQTMNAKLIFAGDPNQVLNKNEFGTRLKEYAKENSIATVKLTNKVRSNQNLAEFIKGIMNSHYPVDKNYPINNKHISIEYFNNDDEALFYIDRLKKESSFKILVLPGSIRFQKDMYSIYNHLHENAYNVIGQEFDNVATLLGSNITYSDNGKLVSNGTYYDSGMALFQNITRTRLNLKLIIVNNPQLLERCINLLK